MDHIGGEMDKICGFFDFLKYGIQYLELRKVPLVLMLIAKSNYLTSVFSRVALYIAEALFTKISIPPKV